MSVRVELSYTRFFEPKQLSPRIGDALHECISARSALQLSLGPSGVSLSVDGAEATDGVMSLVGRWRSPFLEGTPRSAGALVMAPLVFRIEQVLLPHDCLFTLGRADRSVADFCMRNFFYAACRRAPMRFHSAEAVADPTTAKGSRALARTYLWIAKSHLKDKVFDRDGAPELILACAHLPLFEFTSALMDSGAGEYRILAARAEAKRLMGEQERAFKDVRKHVLALYRT